MDKQAARPCRDGQSTSHANLQTCYLTLILESAFLGSCFTVCLCLSSPSRRANRRFLGVFGQCSRSQTQGFRCLLQCCLFWGQSVSTEIPHDHVAALLACWHASSNLSQGTEAAWAQYIRERRVAVKVNNVTGLVNAAFVTLFAFRTCVHAFASLLEGFHVDVGKEFLVIRARVRAIIIGSVTVVRHGTRYTDHAAAVLIARGYTMGSMIRNRREGLDKRQLRAANELVCG